MSGNVEDQTIDHDKSCQGDSGEEKFDEVIGPEDLFPIILGRPSKQADDVDANKDHPPPLPTKTHVVPAFCEPESEQATLSSAATILGFKEDDAQQERHQPSDEEVHGAISSESVKAFFGTGTGDTVDAGRESLPSYEYNMNHKHRGCFIIFNHMNFHEHLNVNSRKGTDEDKHNLARTAKKLGFEYIRIFDDLGVHDILKWVKKIANSDHSKYDCFALAVLTHGDEGDILYARDSKYPVDAITEPFMAKNCPSLAGKPKMFFLQACRGVTLDEGAEIGDTVDSKVTEVANKTQKEVLIIPNAADFLLAFSTVPGYYAWRNQACGSWFIQALCKCLVEFGDHLELMQIMTRVNRMVAYDFTSYSKNNLAFHGKKQIPSIVTRLTHEVFFRKKTKSGSPIPLRKRYHSPMLEERKSGKTDVEAPVQDQAKLVSLKETNL